MKDTRQFWEKKSRLHKKDIRGVLFGKPYPKFINHSFHNWSVEKIREEAQGGNLKFLDLGCSYGRVSAELLEAFPSLEGRGLDISKTYVEIYNADLAPRAKALVGDIRSLPFEKEEFDLVFTVATLMYIQKEEDQWRVFQEIFRTLKSGGKLVVIERTPLMGISDFPKKLRRKPVDYVSFTRNEIGALIERAGGKILSTESWPLSFLPLFICYKAVKK